MGFIEDIDKFASKMPSNLEMYVFSATIPEKLKPFLNKYMESPAHVKIGKRKVVYRRYALFTCSGSWNATGRKNCFKYLKEFHLI